MKLLCGCEGAHVVQARLSGEAPEKEGMASDCLKGLGGEVGERGSGRGLSVIRQLQRGACVWRRSLLPLQLQ